MPNENKWSASPSLTAVILGADVSPSLKGLTNNGKRLSNEIENATGLNQNAVIELLCKSESAFSSGGYFEIYIIPKADGTNYTDGSDSVDPPYTALAGVIPVRASTAAQRLSLWGIVLPPTDFKILLVNKAGQTLSTTDGENVLKIGFYNDEVQ